MEFLTQQQRLVVGEFGNHCKKLIEYGFAYAGAHPEAQKRLNCEAEKIKMIEGRMRARDCFDRMLRDANIQYIARIIKLGLVYVKSNPQCAALIYNVQRSINEYDRVRQEKREQARQVDEDFMFKDVYRQLNEINEKLTSMQTRTQVLKNKTKFQNFQPLKKTGVWDKFKDEVDQSLNEQRARMKARKMAAEEKFKTVPPQRMNETFDSDDYDDEGKISEIILNQEDLTKPPAVRVGQIERHLVIPVHSEDPKTIPKITPKVFFNRNASGEMQLNVKLDFAERVLCRDKLVNSINIQSMLPQPTRRRR